MDVTFDSNVWQRVVRPDSFAKDPRHSEFKKIRAAIENRSLRGYISETVGTLEAIKKIDRLSYFGEMKAEINTSARESSDNQIEISLSIGPNNALHPGLPSILSDSLDDAFNLGIRLLSAPRFGTPRPLSFLLSDGTPKPEIYAEFDSEDSKTKYFEYFGIVLREIENREVGRAVAVNIGNDISNSRSEENLNWFEALNHPRDMEDIKNIQKAIAEWADGDSVAVHIAKRNDIFCTEDSGHSAANSIFSDVNRKWLSEKYDVKICNIHELAELS